ncbi:MAG: DNA-binding protein [Campylobacterota bacterium]
MSKMTVAEASEYFKVSKEAIHNRIRRGTLDCVIEHGTKYVVVGEVKNEPAQINAGNDKYYSYIEQENAVLKAKISELEGETRSLREQREQMLIEEKVKIEQIYKERDIQLRNVLEVVASKFLTHQNMDAVIEEAVTAEEAEPFDDVIDVEEEDDFVSLKQFLKLKMYSKKKRTKIKARFEKYAFDDERILLKGGKIYLTPNHYDYSDLIR